MEQSLDYDYTFKYIIVGDPSVGKSAFLHFLNTHSFQPQTKSTMGVEFVTKKLGVGSSIVKLQIWDTVHL
jgi:GTPase SAR1 family protein